MLQSTKTEPLNWLKGQRSAMVDALKEWAAINTHTFNLKGLKQFGAILEPAFEEVGDSLEWRDLERADSVLDSGSVQPIRFGQGLLVSKRAQASKKVLLVIHMDTVYPESNAMPVVVGQHQMRGPGVADAKGGIAVLLWALKAFEKESDADSIGWTVFLNSDEEVGSLGSMHLLKQLAKEHQVGLVFEPSLPNGNLVGERKGSGNFSIVIKGRSAHAGREHHLGCNAIVPLCQALEKIDGLNDPDSGLTVNVGKVAGGTALNVVPDTAVGRFNIRIQAKEQMEPVLASLREIVFQLNQKEGLSAKLHGGFFSPPKAMDDAHQQLFKKVLSCGNRLGLDLSTEATGGVCDGNKLASFGLPTVDTLGVKGGSIHSPDEYCEIDSLSERAQLTYLLLSRLNKDS